MPLEAYRRKRDFRATPEPAGKAAGGQGGDSFVIQKHDALRLHYDFRLEFEGVLKSWAVAKGPSLVPGERRLAVHVEDHPLEYGDFEGTIPKGEYGGGTVVVWDRGHWSPIGDARKGYAKGHLDFELHGEKLHGRWHLVRMAGKPREKRENWLLIKGDDAAARPDGPDILEERPESAKTGRLIDEVAGEAPSWSSRAGRLAPSGRPDAKSARSKIKGARRAPLPDFVEPEAATLCAKPPAGSGWIHEIKFDGYRIEARIEAGRAKLLTRSGLDWTGRFGKEVQAAFGTLPVGAALIDGEIVVEATNGNSDFSALQADLSDGRSDRFTFYAFDLLHLDGLDLRDAGLLARKQALRQILAGAPPILRHSEHFEQSGDLVQQHACRLGLEGIVSKRRDAPYRSGRGRDWLKSKCSARQEFVIGGYVPSTASSRAIGSLVLGYYQGERLIHVGRVGTGYTATVAADLYQRLERIRSPTSRFADSLGAEAARGVRYVRPDLVVEVEFRNWTADHHLRHAAFRGLREDKPAAEVVMESPVRKTDPTPPPTVKLTHPDRLYWPDAGVTKQGLADYYSDVWPYMAPFVVGRPLALLRCPEGMAGECFFQKHAWKGLGPNIHPAQDPKATEQVLTIDGLDGLIGLVQSGVLEVHPWGSSLAALEQPDMVVFDLDPADDVPWPRVIDASEEIRARLVRIGLAGFLKTSGGKGLHVVVPLVPRADWAAAKRFAKNLADQMTADSPDRFIATVSKAKRHGKILIDYLRNARGATAVAPYSTRARPRAPVSMPLAWEELAGVIAANHFTVANARPRLQHLDADPWAEFRRAAVPLPARTASRRRAG